MAGSILAFASAKIRGNQSESSKISEEPSDEYEALSHSVREISWENPSDFFSNLRNFSKLLYSTERSSRERTLK